MRRKEDKNPLSGIVYVSDSLNLLLNKTTEHDSKILVDMYKHYGAEYERACEKHPNDPEAVANAFQQALQLEIDETLETEPDANVSCGKGCSFCCYLQVDITKEEAILILKYSKEKNIPINIPRLKRQNKPSEEFLKLPLRNKKCNFLGDSGECKIYSIRPMSCRKLISVSPPSFCDTVENPGGQVKRYVVASAEVISSAACQASKSGTMAQMLLNARKK